MIHSETLNLFIKIKIIVLLFVLAVLNIGCEKDEFEVKYPDPGFFGVCFSDMWNQGFDELIIKDEQSYQAFGESVRDISIVNLDCSAAVLPEINFNEYFLIGKFTSGGGCSVEYERTVTETDNKLVYVIDVDYSGQCMMLIANMNWALVPVRYKNHQIEFTVR